MLVAAAVPVVWGLGVVIAKPAVAECPPLLLMGLRFCASALILLWFVRVPRALLVRLFWVALIGSACQYGLTFNGLRYLDAGTTALVVQAEVPFLTLLGVLWLKERLAPRKLLGMAVAFAGIYLVVGEPRVQGEMDAVAMVLAGAFAWAVGQAMMRRLGHLGGLTAIAWISAFAGPQLLLASALFESGQTAVLADAGWTLWATVLYLGVVMNVVGYGCWYHVLGRYQIQRVAPFLLLLPVTSVAGGALFLGEPLGAPVLLGGAIVLAGVALITVERRAVPAISASTSRR